jgi:WD40 repeat protein
MEGDVCVPDPGDGLIDVIDDTSRTAGIVTRRKSAAAFSSSAFKSMFLCTIEIRGVTLHGRHANLTSCLRGEGEVMKRIGLLVLAAVLFGGAIACTGGNRGKNTGKETNTVAAAPLPPDNEKAPEPEPPLPRKKINPLDVPSINSITRREGFFDVAFMPDGKQLLSASLHGVILWDIESGRVVRVMDKSQGYGGLTLSDDGKWVCSPGLSGPVVIWEVATGKIEKILRDAKYIRNISPMVLSANNRFALTCGLRVDEESNKDRTFLHLWDVSKGEIIKDLDGGGRFLAISKDGSLGATLGFKISLWDLNTGLLLRTLEYQYTTEYSGFRGVRFYQDGSLLYYLGSEVRVWEVQTERQFIFPLAYSPDMRFYFTKESTDDDPNDGTLTLWDMDTAKVVTVLEREDDYRKCKVEFSRDGKLVALAGMDRLLQVWDVEKGTWIRDLIVPDHLRANLRRLIRGGAN